MRSNGENKNTISAFILKISRKLRDSYLSELAHGKVSCGTILSLFSVCVRVCV